MLILLSAEVYQYLDFECFEMFELTIIIIIGRFEDGGWWGVVVPMVARVSDARHITDRRQYHLPRCNNTRIPMSNASVRCIQKWMFVIRYGIVRGV